MTPMLIPMLLGALAATKPVAMPASVNGQPTIMHLANRTEVITITAGPKGPLYSATTNDGKVLVSGASLQQLRDEHPELYKRLHPAITVAADASSIEYADLSAR